MIIPAYNTAPYIHRAIGSSLRQTHRNIEILIVDDGSTDDTLRVAEYFAGTDSRIRVFTQKNAGVSAARNHGINEARGEYLVFLDSDDWMEDDAIEILLDAQREHPGKLIAANFYGVKFEGGSANLTRHTGIENTESLSLSAEETLSAIYKLHFYFIHAKLYSLQILRESGLRFRKNIHYGEDSLFNFQYLLRIGGIFYCNRILWNILRRPGSASNVPYSERRIFVDGKFNDYIQMAIDSPLNTPETRRLLKIHHGRELVYEIKRAIEMNAEYDRLKQVRKATGMYPKEFLCAGTVSPREKCSYILHAYMPVPLLKALRFLWYCLKFLCARIPPENPGKIIPDWQDFPKAPGIPV
ncbi:MAG: glycosyltransferase family 2 protein [Synergistaceae bacterium]|nr:glycosyltransferase family 2 protein [Synergistaceae bacterium]